ncbi:TnsD family transposase [Aromatoleum toluclasticum]|uniref:TnsD family transposase n=1 Tax=Aromatoleum toluclasticum TaxID=92003 RepID=UPI001D1934CC|nr:TnsD family transposase [Aromatoleum toluclasticum]MCC4118620.1 TnsD family transposase [Aromatoleum toluclasticum]
MNFQEDLFSSSPLLDWLPDETLFSLVSRLHALWGARDSSRTSRLLFGRPRAGSHHDFPSCLDVFAIRTQSKLGDAQSLARTRTLLAYYLPFLSVQDEQYCLAALCGGSPSHLKFHLGLLTSRFRAHHPLKACVSCMKEDVARYGWAYWHLQHQYPGVWWCAQHHEPLRESNYKSSGVGRFQWHLPDEEALYGRSREAQSVLSSNGAVFAQLAQVIQDVVRIGGERHIDTEVLHRVYRGECAARGWLTPYGRIHWPPLLEDCLNHVAGLRVLPELQGLPANSDQARAQLGRLLRPQRSGAHPIRHMVMIAWLFGNVARFWEAYSNGGIHTCVVEEGEAPIGDCDLDIERRRGREQLVSLLRDHGMSMRAAAHRVGVDVATAMTWAAKEGIQPKRRGRVLDRTGHERLVGLLREGAEKKEAASALGVSIQTVTRILLTTVGLHAQWSKARFEKLLRRNRDDWGRLCEEFSGAGMKIVRSMAPAAYAWLYRNDRAWLVAHRPERDFRNTVRNTDPLWWERDRALSASVISAAEVLASEPGRRRIFLWQLYQAVPALKPKLSVLSRLPLTQRIVERSLDWRPEDGALVRLLD